MLGRLAGHGLFIDFYTKTGFYRHVELSARLAAGMTLIRDSYDFGGLTFHRAGAITVAASLGAGLRWP